MENATSVNQLVMKIKLRHYTYFFARGLKMMKGIKEKRNFKFDVG